MDIQTAKKAMDATIQLLSQVNVPMVLFEQIGIPLRDAIINMKIGLDALNTDENQEGENKDA